MVEETNISTNDYGDYDVKIVKEENEMNDKDDDDDDLNNNNNNKLIHLERFN